MTTTSTKLPEKLDSETGRLSSKGGITTRDHAYCSRSTSAGTPGGRCNDKLSFPGSDGEAVDRRDNQHLVEPLTKSKIYQDYEQAFSEATGLPVALRPVESWQLPLHGKGKENSFCALMAQKSRSCAACLQMQQQLSDNGTHEAVTITC